MLELQNNSCNIDNKFDVEIEGFLSNFCERFCEQKTGKKTPLVNISKSIHLFDPKIGTIYQFIQLLKPHGTRREFCPFLLPERDALFERFELQNVARKILQNAPHPRGQDGRWQVNFCLRHLVKLASQVDVRLNKELQRAYYKNLMTCGSVWTCSLCAPKISSGRGQEITAAADTHMAAGGAMYMLTYTFGHSRQDSLIRLLGDSVQTFGFRGALRRLRNSKGYKKLLAYFGFVGLVRTIELTHAFFNGWHPHGHELWFCTRTLTRSELREFKNCLFDLWLKACLKSELALPNREHGIDVVEAHSPAEYLQKWGHEQKWGVGAELTRSHTKRSRDREGKTPFDFLRLVASGDRNSDYYAKRFVEYATAFYGVRQCFWSRGLKQAFGIGEVSDEELAARESEDFKPIASIDKETWGRLLRQPFDCRAVVLRLAETGGREAVERFLSELK